MTAHPHLIEDDPERTLLVALTARARFRRGIDVDASREILERPECRAALRAHDVARPVGSPAPVRVERMGVVLPFRAPRITEAE